MRTSNRPKVEFVRQVLRYEDGKLFWFERPLEHFPNASIRAMWNTRWASKEAGSTVSRHGYMIHVVRFVDVGYRRSDLVWVIINGEWPSMILDHKNRNSTDDRIENLRLATNSQNIANSRTRKDNTTGFKGVSLHKQTGKYKATINVNKQTIYLGLFLAPEEAYAAYCEAARKYFGDFACGG